MFREFKRLDSAQPLTRRAFAVVVCGATVAAMHELAAAEKPSPEVDFPRLTRGVNLHHLLNWPDAAERGGQTDYVWPPFQTEGYKIGDSELERLHALGFDFLRVTADPSIFIASDAARRSYLSSLALRVVQRLVGAGFKVIFDLHPVAVNPDYGPLKLVDSADTKPFRRYADVVEELARAFRELPHDSFAFELMNEPWLEGKSGVARWQPMMEILHARARKGSATLPLVLTGAAWSDAKALMQLDTKPFTGSNVLYTFHYYDPHTYTHQGVEGDEGAYLAGLRWPASHENVAHVRDDAFARISEMKKPPGDVRSLHQMTDKLLTDYELTAHNAERVGLDFAAVAKWAADNSLPPGRILLGEFGCVRSANQVALGEDREEWFRTIRENAEKFGFPWALWSYKGYGGMGLVDADHLDSAAVKGLKLQSQ